MTAINRAVEIKTTNVKPEVETVEEDCSDPGILVAIIIVVVVIEGVVGILGVVNGKEFFSLSSFKFPIG